MTFLRQNRCRWPDCQANIPRYHWGCETHWWRLPLRIRKRIVEAWRRMRANRTQPNLDAYHTALEDAQAWIKKGSTESPVS